MRRGSVCLKVEYEIIGTEYFGSPPPINGIDLDLPPETIVQTGGFPTCDEALLLEKGPIGCPPIASVSVAATSPSTSNRSPA
jgi:hypothetical protein